MDRWTRVAAALVLGGWDLGDQAFEPVRMLADASADTHGVDDLSARVAVGDGHGPGWRIFDGFLAIFDDVPIALATDPGCGRRIGAVSTAASA